MFLFFCFLFCLVFGILCWIFSEIFLKVGVISHLENVAHVLASSHSEIATLAPAWAPRVTNHPVITTSVSAVADDNNTMIGRLVHAIWIIDDATSVTLEYVRDIDANSHWSNRTNDL